MYVPFDGIECPSFSLCFSISLSTEPVNGDVFVFFHEGAQGCLGVQGHSLSLSESCEDDAQKWKWVTRGRLFNLGSSLCLGLTTGNYSSREDASLLGVYPCDREPPGVRWTWYCSQVLDNLNLYLPSPSHPVNPSANSSVVASDVKPLREGLKWRLFGDDQDLCSRSYRGK